MDERTGGPALGVAGSTAFVVTAGAVVVGAGVALAAVRYAGLQPFERGLEGVVGAMALGAVVAAPGVLALLSLTDRPALLLPAAVMLVPLSFLSLAGVTLPLLVPAAMLFVGYGRRSAGRSGPARAAITTLAVVVLLVAAGVSLLVRQDPRSYASATGGGSVSDVITFAESLTCFALVGGALVVGWLLAPQGRRSSAASTSSTVISRRPGSGSAP